MQVASHPSWRISEGIDHGLALALYVRDRAGLERFVVTEPDVGPLDRAPDPDAGPRHGLAAAVREWPRWWQHVLSTPGQRHVIPAGPGWGHLAHLPTVNALASDLLPEFLAWLDPAQVDERERAVRGDSIHLTRFVNGYQRRLGRPVRPFRLEFRVLPLAAAAGWVIDRQQVIISSRLLGDRLALERFLGPVMDTVA